MAPRADILQQRTSAAAACSEAGNRKTHGELDLALLPCVCSGHPLARRPGFRTTSGFTVTLWRCWTAPEFTQSGCWSAAPKLTSDAFARCAARFHDYIAEAPEDKLTKKPSSHKHRRGGDLHGDSGRVTAPGSPAPIPWSSVRAAPTRLLGGRTSLAPASPARPAPRGRAIAQSKAKTWPPRAQRRR
jgi:hypothetical protein